MVQALLNPASPGHYFQLARPWIATKPVNSFFSRKRLTAACMSSATGDKLVWVATNNKVRRGYAPVLANLLARSVS